MRDIHIHYIVQIMVDLELEKQSINCAFSSSLDCGNPCEALNKPQTGINKGLSSSCGDHSLTIYDEIQKRNCKGIFLNHIHQYCFRVEPRYSSDIGKNSNLNMKESSIEAVTLWHTKLKILYSKENGNQTKLEENNCNEEWCQLNFYYGRNLLYWRIL